MRESSSPQLRPGWTAARGFFVLSLVVLLPLIDVLGGVLVAPTVIFMSSSRRTGRMTVQNPSDSPREVTIRFSFGLPISDSLGNVNVKLQDSAISDPQSALGWIKAFPRKMILPPNATQVVRFVANPPKDISDGEYWARVVIQSRDAESDIPQAEEGAITTKLNMVMQTAIMLKYRHGDVISQLEVVNTEVKSQGDLVQVLVDMESKGNASYVGVLSCRLLDADDREISRNKLQLAVYHSLRRRVLLSMNEGDFTEPYHVEVSISTKGRTDIAAEDMLPGNEILLSQSLE